MSTSDPTSLPKTAAEGLSNLGTICIKFCRVHNLRDGGVAKLSTPPELGVVSEKDLKGRAVSHSYRFVRCCEGFLELWLT